MLKILGKGKDIDSIATRYFYSSEDYQDFNIAKSIKLNQRFRKLADFRLQARYLVKKKFIIIPTCCAHHV